MIVSLRDPKVLMASSKEHYERVLSPVYSWMYGGFPAALERNSIFFKEHQISPRKSGIAVDLGAGCGFQSIPLAKLGYKVTAIDLDRNLLAELTKNADGQSIETVEGNLLRFRDYVDDEVELVVCMTDTLLHLESVEDVQRLFVSVFAALEASGMLIITFRDLTDDLKGLDRFVPVRSDCDTIFTCFLEYEPQAVRVHDLVYRRAEGAWEFSKSFYRKLRLSQEWVIDRLIAAGFADVQSELDSGQITVIATKVE